jgi:anti-sigma factor RsiW
MNCEQTQALLPAHVDGELGIPESIALEQHLQSCPDCRAELASQQALRAAIQKHTPYFTAPMQLENRIRAALPSASAQLKEKRLAWWRTWSWPQLGAAFTSVAAIVLSVSLYVATPSATDLLAQDVVANHVRSLMVDHLSDVASSDQHTVKPWFNGKIDFAPTVQDLTAQGFPLVGGRLDYLDRHPVAALVYRHKKHVINVYIWPMDKPQTRAVKTLSLQGYHLAYWSKDGMMYWAVSDTSPKNLLGLVVLLQQQS